jgi:hypothetical protein
MGVLVQSAETGELVTAAVIADAKDDEVERAAVQQSWQVFAEDFWNNSVESVAKAPKKLERTKVWTWLVTTWTMLVIATGRGWDQFIQSGPVDLRAPAISWPSISVAIDQGGDGFSACQFMLFMGVNLLLLSDTSHRVWNDCQLAIHDCNLWYWCLCVIVMLNYENGPWEGCRWFEELRAGVWQWLRLSTWKDKLWQGAWENIKL